MELQNRRVLVFGTGKSGIAAAELLLGRNAVPVLYDGNRDLDPDTVRSRIHHEKAAGTDVILGDLPEEEIDRLDLVVMSPGVPCDLPVMDRIRARRIPVWGEIELAFRCGKGKVYAITGTNGKTTSTALLGEILSAWYPEVYVVGNIGNPYTEVVSRQTENAVTAAEISSFQLETIDSFHPCACAITNITPDHLNRHHTMEEYIRVKRRISENQTMDDLCILNYEDEILRSMPAIENTRVLWFSSRRPLKDGLYYQDGGIYLGTDGSPALVIRTDELQLVGLHNFENVMTAVGIALHAGVPMESIRKTLRAFRGVEHRIEYVTEIGGVRYYNDSKGTNPDAAIKGIQAMNRPTLLIGGGYDKESSYEDWIRCFDGKVKFFALIGQTREKIRDAAAACGFPEDRIALFDNLQEAVSACAERAEEGDAVLLSPACASWGQFDNYEQRGDLFKAYVHALEE